MFKIQVQNLDELISKFWKINVDKTLTDGVKKTIIFLEGQSKRDTPVDTWILRNSYKTRFSDWWQTGQLENFRKYWIFVHEGTKFIKSNPWMTRAVEKSEWQIETIWNGEIDKLLNTLKV